MKHEILRDKTLAVFFTARVSLKRWHEIGMIDREVALYNKLAKHLKGIYLFTYGDSEEVFFSTYLANNIKIVPKKKVSSDLLYSLLIPFIHRKILKNVNILKTNQMMGAWSAVLAKLIYRKRLVVRTGYVLSLNFARKNPNSKIKQLMRVIEWAVYKFADAVISSSQANLEYVERNYHPQNHILIPNYVETDVFKPMDVAKKKGSICFVGRLTKEKNLLVLLEALGGLPYTLSIIGSGGQDKELREFANDNVSFLGNIPNHKLPEILNQHELFILPSLWEGMPKTLLEAMSCGLPVIGTDVDGIREIIRHKENGILCDTDSGSIRQAIMSLMEKEKFKKRIGINARETIEERFCLGKLAEEELKLYIELLT